MKLVEKERELFVSQKRMIKVEIKTFLFDRSNQELK